MNRSKRHNKLFGLLSLVVLTGMLLAACASGGSSYQSPTQPAAQAVPSTTMAQPTATAAATTAAAASEPTISIATDAKLGKILVDGKGMTLYAFTKDTPDQSNCTGGCAKIWPPLLTQGSPKAGDGVDQSKLGSAALPNGSKIVTYNHMPLYYYSKDSQAGDTKGQNFGSIWFVVSSDGQMVKNAAGVPATGGSGSSTAAPAATMAATPAASTGSTSSTALNLSTDAKLGKILVDGQGMTLYVYTKDGPDQSTCTGGCAQAWPPFTATGDVKAGDGVNQSMIGAATLADGSKIVTYNHMPLYHWSGDSKPGDTSGQNVGGVWFAVGPDGKPIEQAQSPTGY